MKGKDAMTGLPELGTSFWKSMGSSEEWSLVKVASPSTTTAERTSVWVCVAAPSAGAGSEPGPSTTEARSSCSTGGP